MCLPQRKNENASVFYDYKWTTEAISRFQILNPSEINLHSEEESHVCLLLVMQMQIQEDWTLLVR